jgi:subtilisin-like proprotein convertase family protein
VCSKNSGDLFPIGLTTVSCVATDASGNSNSCSFTVTVQDTIPPMITQCATNQTLIAGSGCTATLPDLRPQVTATDACGFTLTQTPPPGTALGTGPNIVTITATDPGNNTAQCMATITVVDNTAPTLMCPPTIFAKALTTNGAPVTYMVSSSDNCGAPTVVCTPASGSIFPLGTNAVSCTATDGSGNSNSCSFTVIMRLCVLTNMVVNTTIPDADPSGVARTIVVNSQIGQITDVNVTLHVTGGWNGDLFAYLVHRSGFSVLLNRAGRRAAAPLGYSDAGFNVMFDDQSTNGDVHVYRLTLNGNHATPLGGPLTNAWAPDARATDPAFAVDTDARTEFLSSFNGLNANGEWTLFIADVEGGDESTCVDWGLEICGTFGTEPTITQQPMNLTVECGSNATFSVTCGQPRSAHLPVVFQQRRHHERDQCDGRHLQRPPRERRELHGDCLECVRQRDQLGGDAHGRRHDPADDCLPV